MWSFFEFPPLHPLLVHFTAALLPMSFVMELTGRIFNRDSLRAAAWWMLLTGTIVTPFTVLFGWLWLNDMDIDIERQMFIHQWLGTVLAGVYVALTGWRGMLLVKGRKVPVVYLVVLGLMTLALFVQGHIGAQISFGIGE